MSWGKPPPPHTSTQHKLGQYRVSLTTELGIHYLVHFSLGSLVVLKVCVKYLIISSSGTCFLHDQYAQIQLVNSTAQIRTKVHGRVNLIDDRCHIQVSHLFVLFFEPVCKCIFISFCRKTAPEPSLLAHV